MVCCSCYSLWVIINAELSLILIHLPSFSSKVIISPLSLLTQLQRVWVPTAQNFVFGLWFQINLPSSNRKPYLPQGKAIIPKTRDNSARLISSATK